MMKHHYPGRFIKPILTKRQFKRIINKELNDLVAESYSELGRQYLRILESATKDSQIESLYNAVKNFIEENNGVLKREMYIPSISEDFIPVMTVLGQREKSFLDSNQIANPPAGLTQINYLFTNMQSDL